MGLVKINNKPSLLDVFLNDDFFLQPMRLSQLKSTIPLVNIKDTESYVEFEIAAPGIEKTDLILEIDNNILSISANKNDTNEDHDDNFIKKEFAYHNFKRTFKIPDGLNTDNPTATYKNGILTIHLSKETSEKQSVKQIEIT
jgi:HSP20 family protein